MGVGERHAVRQRTKATGLRPVAFLFAPHVQAQGTALHPAYAPSNRSG